MTRPLGEFGRHLGDPLDQLERTLARPGHRAGARGDPRLIADRDGRRETHPEPAGQFLARGGLPLAGGAQRGQRGHTGRIQRRSGVRGHEGSVPQSQPQPASDRIARRRVRRVLGQFHDDAVPVAAQRVVLLRVGVLTEPGGRGRPGVEHRPAQLGSAERIGPAVTHSVDPPPFPSPRTRGSSASRWWPTKIAAGYEEAAHVDFRRAARYPRRPAA
jgi:hypothetical protein